MFCGIFISAILFLCVSDVTSISKFNFLLIVLANFAFTGGPNSFTSSSSLIVSKTSLSQELISKSLELALNEMIDREGYLDNDFDFNLENVLECEGRCSCLSISLLPRESKSIELSLIPRDN